MGSCFSATQDAPVLAPVPFGPVTWPDLRVGVSASDRERPLSPGLVAR
jgi:hypothetical protein